MTKKRKLARIRRLQAIRDELWQEFCHLPRRSSFSGLRVNEELNKIQQELDKLEGDNPSKRYYTEFTIELI